MIHNTLTLNTKSPAERMLSNILPGNLYENSYDNGEYYACVVIAPKKERIMGFEGMWDKIRAHYGKLLVPAYLLVSNGSGGSYFVVFIRK